MKSGHDIWKTISHAKKNVHCYFFFFGFILMLLLSLTKNFWFELAEDYLDLKRSRNHRAEKENLLDQIQKGPLKSIILDEDNNQKEFKFNKLGKDIR